MKSKTATREMIDICHDEEEAVKFDEIIKMLIAAGYYRARIKGLENFDKIVGGMTWCIESCHFEVDVDILFKENLTIGQKIALTEKIVVMLPRMNCPYRIEPHQIQGLDSTHIFPVIKWLINESMRTRKNMSNYVNLFAINHFNTKYLITVRKKSFSIANNTILQNMKLATKSFEPKQFYKQNNSVNNDEFSILSNTLLEYGNLLKIPFRIVDKLQEFKTDVLQDKQNNKEIIERKVQEQKIVENLMENLLLFGNDLCYVSQNIFGKIVNIQSEEALKISKQYSHFSTYLYQDKSVISKHFLKMLVRRKYDLQDKLKRTSCEKKNYEKVFAENTKFVEQYKIKKYSLQSAVRKINDIKIIEEERKFLHQMENLIFLKNKLKDQENFFKEQCRIRLSFFNKTFKKVKTGELQEEKIHTVDSVKNKESVLKLKLQLAKKNRSIASLIRQLDDVPNRSELTQYQRRFMELYNQVSTKHKETKQYYALYNTLDDTKLYLCKELSLLNSIQDNYSEAMASSCGREQFIRQFQMIVEEVQKSRKRTEKRMLEEKHRRDFLNQQLATLMEQHRKYIAAVKQLTKECRKNEILLTKLRE